MQNDFPHVIVPTPQPPSLNHHPNPNPHTYKENILDTYHEVIT